jgi:hypothetical protein
MMKTTTITSILFVFATFALADTLTVTISPNDQQRTAAAFGEILNLTNAGGQPRAATNAEIEAAMGTWLQGQTQDYERRKNQKAFTPPPFQQGAAKPAAAKAATPTATPKKK